MTLNTNVSNVDSKREKIRPYVPKKQACSHL